MRIALLSSDFREDRRDYSKPAPYFAPGTTALIQGFTRMPNLEVHVLSCVQRKISAPEKLAKNVWYHSLIVPKIGWLRTGYQGCVRAVRRRLKKLNPDIVHGIGTERDGAFSAVFSGFPNVITMAGIMSEQERLLKPRVGSYLWCAARLERLILAQTRGVICNSKYTEAIVRPRARRTWIIYPALREEFLTAPRTDRPEKCILLNAGVISPRKRQLEILEMAGRLHRTGLQFEIHFIGSASSGERYAAAFLKKMAEVEPCGYAQYKGNVHESELVSQFDSAAGLIHFPTEEAFGSCVCEALARNLKFFAARTGGIVEMTKGMPEVGLFDINDWSGLAEAIARWVKEGHPTVCTAANAMHRRFGLGSYCDEHLRVYQEILDAGD